MMSPRPKTPASGLVARTDDGIFDHLKRTMPGKLKHFADYSHQNADAAKQFVEAQLGKKISSTWWLLYA
jgi:hypothetical protein